MQTGIFPSKPFIGFALLKKYCRNQLLKGIYSRILGGLRPNIYAGSSEIYYHAKIGRLRFYNEYTDNELL